MSTKTIDMKWQNHILIIHFTRHDAEEEAKFKDPVTHLYLLSRYLQPAASSMVHLPISGLATCLWGSY